MTVDGKAQTQPLKIVMDPRSPATTRDLEQQLELGRQIFAETISSRQALAEIRSVQKQLSDLEQKLGADHADLKSNISKLEANIRQIQTGSGDPANSSIGLQKASTGLASALAVVESGDRPTPSQALALYHESSQALKLRLADWNQFKTTRLPQLNQQLRQENMTPIAISEIPEEVELG
jgi:hypothetical protein